MPPILIPAAATLAAAAALTAYGVIAPESQLFGPTLVAPPEPSHLALTFDDGPNPAATPQILEILARRSARATFFLIGAHVLREPALTRQIHAAGHAIGNHTMHHPFLPRHSAAFIRDEIQTGNRVLEDTLGIPITLFRPPHGGRSPAVFRAARELNLTVVQWNLIVGDWKTPSAEILLHRIQRGLAANRRRRRGTNLVLHDGSQHTPTAIRTPTIEAVQQLLAELPAETRFVTPPQWL